MMGILLEAAQPDSGISLGTAQLIVGALGTLGLGAVATAVITGLFSRKKLGADATEIITKAAAGVVERTEADNARLRLELHESERRRDEVQEEMRRIIDEHSKVLQLHTAWDQVAKQLLEQAGITGLPDPPPFYPPDGTPGKLMKKLEPGGSMGSSMDS